MPLINTGRKALNSQAQAAAMMQLMNMSDGIANNYDAYVNMLEQTDPERASLLRFMNPNAFKQQQFFNGGFLMPAQEGGNINFPSEMGYRAPRMANGGDISIADLRKPNWLTKYNGGGPTDKVKPVYIRLPDGRKVKSDTGESSMYGKYINKFGYTEQGHYEKDGTPVWYAPGYLDEDKPLDLKIKEEVKPMETVTVSENPLITGARRKAKGQIGTWEDWGKTHQTSNLVQNSGMANPMQDLSDQQQAYRDKLNKTTYQNIIDQYPIKEGEERLAYINRLNTLLPGFVEKAKGYGLTEPFDPENSAVMKQWVKKGYNHLGALAQATANPTIAGYTIQQGINKGNQPVSGLSAEEAQNVGITQPFETLDNIAYQYAIKPGVTALDNLGSTPSSIKQRDRNMRYVGPTDSEKLMISLLNPLNYLGPGELISGGRNLFRGAEGVKNIVNASKESGLLSNAYRINPFAEKLNNANRSYRVAGLDALQDFQNTGVLRSVQQGAPEGATLLQKTLNRPTSFPSFQKGYADLRYLPEEGGAIFETSLPTFRRGDINPVTGKQIRGRHYAHRVIDPSTGEALSSIPGANIKAYGDKPHWVKGFQEIPNPNETGLLPNSTAASAKSGTFKLKYPESLRRWDLFAEEVLNTIKPGRKKAIEEGNQWFTEWVQHPETQSKIDNAIADLTKEYQRVSGQIPSNNTKALDLHKDTYDRTMKALEFAKTYKGSSKEYPLLNQIFDNLKGNPTIHDGNWGVSFGHSIHPWSENPKYRPTAKDIKQVPRIAGAWISRKANNLKRTSTTVHENAHEWLKDILMGGSGTRGEVLNNLSLDVNNLFHEWETLKNQGKTDKEIEAIMGKSNKNLGYLGDPTEVHARVMELRKHYKLKPGQKIDPAQALQIMQDVGNKKTQVNSRFASIFPNEDAMANMFNNLWAVPAAVGVGYGLTNGTHEQTHNQQKYGGWIDNYANGGGVTKYKTGGQKCPKGYINIDGECIDITSEEYIDMLDQGRVGTMVDGKFWGNKATMQPVVIYSSKDKDTQNFFNKIKEKYSPEFYQTLIKLQTKYGNPHVTLKDKRGFFDPKFRNNPDKVRAHYNPFSQRMYLGNKTQGIKHDYLAELAHQKQLMDKGSLDFNLRGVGEFFGNVGNMIKNVESYDDAYERGYDTPGAIEYQAHEEIEPDLDREFTDIYSDKQWENDYYKYPGTFPKPTQTYQNGGGLLSRTVTCSNCGHSWKGVTGGMDPLTCHNCGGMIKMKSGGLIKAEGGTEVKCGPGQVNIDGKCVNITSQEYKDAYAKGIGSYQKFDKVLNKWITTTQDDPDARFVTNKSTLPTVTVQSKLTEDQKRALLRKDMLETSLSNQNQTSIGPATQQPWYERAFDIATHPGTAIRAYNKKGYIPNNLGAVADNMGGSSSIINTLSPFTWAKGAYNATKQFASNPVQTTKDVIQGTGNLLGYAANSINRATLLPGQTMPEYTSPFGDAGTNERALNFVGNVGEALPLLEFAPYLGAVRSGVANSMKSNVIPKLKVYGKDLIETSKAAGTFKLPTYKNAYRWQADVIPEWLQQSGTTLTPEQQALTASWYTHQPNQLGFYMRTRPGAGNINTVRLSENQIANLENNMSGAAKGMSGKTESIATADKHLYGELNLSPEARANAKQIRFDVNPTEYNTPYGKYTEGSLYDRAFLEDQANQIVGPMLDAQQQPILGIPRKYFPFKEGGITSNNAQYKNGGSWLSKYGPGGATIGSPAPTPQTGSNSTSGPMFSNQAGQNNNNNQTNTDWMIGALGLATTIGGYGLFGNNKKKMIQPQQSSNQQQLNVDGNGKPIIPNQQGMTWNYNPNIEAQQIQSPTVAPSYGPNSGVSAANPANGMAMYGGSLNKKRKGGDVSIYGRRNYKADTPSFFNFGGATNNKMNINNWLNKYKS